MHRETRKITLTDWLLFHLSMGDVLYSRKTNYPRRTIDCCFSSQAPPRLSAAVRCCANLDAAGYSFKMLLLLMPVERLKEWVVRAC